MMIVLHTTRYGDSSLIVHGYTREEGRTSLMLRGAFRTSGKRRPSHPGAVLLHPLPAGVLPEVPSALDTRGF